MIQNFELLPGVTLRFFADSRFKQGCLSFQLVRPMAADEAAMNALLPAVLLRGTKQYPDLRAITLHLDDLYGASVSALVRRIGDYQTTGLYCGFMEDRYAMGGDEILAPMVEFLRQLLLEPVMEGDGFSTEFVESEKKNLISTIESELNDKRVYASAQLLKTMCPQDAFGIPRLGDKESVERVDAETLYRHYQKILRDSRIELFYVGSAQPEGIIPLLKNMLAGIDRCYVNLPEQTAFHDAGGQHTRETMEITQSKLCMGFVTPITNRTRDFAAMQLLNTVFGAGMTSKLFMNVREKMSLCYSIGSGYYGTKGIITVSAGIDAGQEETVRSEILRQLQLCQNGEISAEELTAAREAVLSGLRTVHDSPGSIEGYHSTAALSGLCLDLDEYREAVGNVQIADVVAAAKTVKLHSSFFLQGVGE
ncbi:MAG: insulinase family protein [Oscillospiraceae bacterium]|nr:insulinase family protein [Oscillospiraceae bacterium]